MRRRGLSGRRRIFPWTESANEFRNYGLVPALVELLTARLKVVPLSKRRLRPVRLSVDPPSAEAPLDCVICNPLREPVRFPVALAAVLVVAPTVLPTALVVVPATLPTVEVVVFTTPPAV